MDLTLVIPTLNEELGLPAFLPEAVGIGDEVVVSDGGSSDQSAEIARSLGAKVVCGPPGRGGQLNRGAAASDSELLLFLHADTRLPPDAADLVRRAIAGGAVGGGFLVRFAPVTGSLRLAHRLTTLRTRITGCPLGDQAQFVRRDAFEALGGFQEWPILEDLDFIRRLKRHGRTQIIDEPVITSSRRFQSQGALRTSATNYLIWMLYFVGVSPLRLARLYQNIR